MVCGRSWRVVAQRYRSASVIRVGVSAPLTTGVIEIGCGRLAKANPVRDERMASLEQRGLRS